MATEYTKGPYFVTDDGFIRAAVGERRLYIANTVDIPHADGGEKATKANANLLAASYELLEALIALRSFMWEEGYADQSAPIAQADAAIAKAEAVHE